MRRHKRNGVFGQVMPYAHQAQKKALKAQKKAQKKAGPVVEQAWDRVAPAVESAKDRLTPAAVEAREKAEAAVVSAMIASEPYRKEAMKRGTAAWLALRGDLQPPTPRKRHWIRNVLLLGGIGGSAFVAYKILRHGPASEWMPKQASSPATEEAETGMPEPADATTADRSGKHKDDAAEAAMKADKEHAATATRASTNRTTSSANERKPGDLPKS
jgi:hypothetical protein